MASYKPTKGMKEEAQKGLDWRSEFGRGGTEVGIARARDIVNDKNLSESTVKRMYSFFSRHEVDKEGKGFTPDEDGFPSNGRIAWALWGGDPGFTWSTAIVERLKAEEERSYDEERPYANEHAARIKDPANFDEFRRENDALADGVHVIYGIKDDVSEIQSIRFEKTKYTPQAAKKWLAEHDFDYIKFEDAIEERQASEAIKKSLQKKADEHNEEYGDDAKRKTNVGTLEKVYMRGRGAFQSNPGSVRPSVKTPEQWGLARVNSFLYALRNLKFRSGKHDTDLLPKAHPLSSEENGDRIASMDTESRHIKDIRETEDSVIVEFSKSEDEQMEESSGHVDEEMGNDYEEVRSEEVSEDIETKEAETEEQRDNEESDNEEALRFYSEETLQRAFEFDRNKINEEERTVEIGVSSEEPVMRNFGYEVLGHSQDEIDMSFMASGRSPLLLDHDATKQIGVVEEFKIDAENKRTVAKVRFSKSQLGQEIFDDVKDMIRQNISVGYQVNKMDKEGERDGIPIYRVHGWTPLEVSAVSIPADTSRLVGFGRSKDIQIKSNKPEDKIMENENKTPEVNPNELREQMAKENAAIIDLAVKHNKRDLANDAIAKGVTLEQFRGQLLESLASKPLDLPSNVDMNQKEERSYSLVKAINEAAHGKLSGLEREVSDEIAARTGKQARGFYMPTNISFGQRDQLVGTASAGGNLVPTDHLGDQYIEALKARLLVGDKATILNGLVGDVAIPKMSAEVSNAAFVAENNAPSEGAATFSQVTMSPKTLAAYVDVSRKLSMQSDPSVEQLIRNDIINTFARKIDGVAIEGGGSNEPSGIIASVSNNVEAIGTNGGAVSYDNVVNLVKLVSEDNAILNDDSVCFISHPAVTAKLRTTAKQSSGVEGNFILEPNNTMLGYRYEDSSLVPNDLTKGTLDPAAALIFGDFSQLLLGFYSGVDIIVDPYTGSNAGTIRLSMFQDCDVALRHDDSFAVCKDIDFS